MTQSTALQILKLGHTTLLTGAAGAGKSYVLREYILYLRAHGVRYAVTASTGIASTHINGTTIHAWSGIGIRQKLHSYDMDALEEKQNLYKRWNETQVLIIDEVSMLHASFVDMLDKLAKYMRRSEKPFGGLQVVFTGDFFQLPPVVRGNDEYESAEVFAFTSKAWKEAKPVVCYLTEQFRQEDDKLLNILQAIRDGDMQDEHFEMLKGTSENFHKEDHIKLYTHNVNVDEINKKAFNEIEGKVHTYHMITKGRRNLLESLKNNCLAEEVLELKIGAKVICIKNSPERYFVNGSMGVVSSFTNDDAPVIELKNGKIVTIVSDTWRIEEDGKVRAEISQLPIKLAWAITVHKSQGMTLDRAEIDLGRAFTSGQGYVALSRLKTLEGLYLKGFNSSAFFVSDEVRSEDLIFRKKSEQAENAIKKYSQKQIDDLHEKFLTNSGGVIKELDDDDDGEVSARGGPASGWKVLSHTKTQDMLNKKMSIKEIADERKLSVDTIIGHIEKLVEMKEKVELEHTLPKKKDKDLIIKTFKDLKTTKLTPVFEKLKGKYSYHEIRLVRASQNR